VTLNKAQLKSAPSLSPIWIVPLVALIIAGWLAVRSWQQKGTEIELLFDNASGIQVGQTQVRLKDVPVGKVTKIRLSSDLSKVRVYALLDRQVSRHLSENSRFWLVSPRVSASGVSNLGTLISGIYIVMDPGKPGGFQDVFTGLTEPPAIQSDDQGTQYVLLADSLRSIDLGSPVYFRQLKVGEVTSYRLAENGNNVEIRIFIEAPHDKLVLQRSRFWNVSGVEVSVGADGIKAEVGSIASIINGGIAFENTVGFEAPQRALSDHQFYLYSDRNSVMEERYTLKYFYLLKFSHSVRGLKEGAPVEFRGIKVGEVVDVQLHSVEKEPDSLHVYISMEPQRLEPDGEPSREEFDAQLENLVQQGLRAKLKTANLITGSRMIDLGFPADPAPGAFVRLEQYAEIPTVDDSAEDLEQQLNVLAKKINQIPLEKIGTDLADSLASLNNMLKVLNEQSTAAKLDKTLDNLSVASEQLEATMRGVQTAMQETTATLQSADAMLSPDSQIQYELRTMLQAVQSAAETMERLGEKLNRKPNALIFGEN
jgi:paraquat-inducible protein B